MIRLRQPLRDGHDGFELGVRRCHREVHRAVQLGGCPRGHKVRALDPLHGVPKVVGLDEVPDDDRRTGPGQGGGAMVVAANQRPDRVALVEELARDGCAGLATGGGHEDSGLPGVWGCHGLSSSLWIYWLYIQLLRPKKAGPFTPDRSGSIPCVPSG